jgi:hypothetical protein
MQKKEVVNEVANLRQLGHKRVILNSFSLKWVYRPSGLGVNSNGQSSHSSNVSSAFSVSFSNSPHRLHFVPTNVVRG